MRELVEGGLRRLGRGWGLGEREWPMQSMVWEGTDWWWLLDTVPQTNVAACHCH